MTLLLPELQDDRLITPEINSWGEEKYRLVWNYASIFATSMKLKWHCRVYVDLFAGAGRSRIKGTKRIIPASPMLALDVQDKFDKYIFCDVDDSKMKALTARVLVDHSKVDVQYVPEDSNNSTDKILSLIPRGSSDFKVLTFCFVDPYKLENIAFDTIRKLSVRYMDFLVLIPSGMDANRNESHYISPKNHTVDRFLGTSSWRDEWKNARLNKQGFGDFLTDAFGKKMSELGYIYNGIEKTELIRLTTKNVPLYRLAFFGRHPRGDEFWKEARIYSKPQLDFSWQ